MASLIFAGPLWRFPRRACGVELRLLRLETKRGATISHTEQLRGKENKMASIQPGAKSPFGEHLDDGNTTVAITVEAKRLTLTTGQVEEAIWWLGQIRAVMLPPEPLDVLPGNRVPLTMATNWRVAPFNLNDPCDILLRTIQFGWVALRLVPDSRHELVATLTGAHRTADPSVQKH